MRIFPALGLLLFVSTAASADMGAARSAYDAGHWEDAAAYAQQSGGAEGYAYAAGALVTQLMIEPDYPDRRQLAQRAVQLAEYAYRQDRENEEARLRLAIALGYQGRFSNSFQAYIRGVPQRGRSLLEGVIEDDPRNVWALGTLGAWNLEVARRGGNSGMQALGASVEAGTGFYSQAIALDPDNPALRYFLALGLVALGDPDRFEMAHTQLEIALELTPRDAFEAGVQEEAVQLQSAFQTSRDAAIEWANDRMSR
jgi:tetratricopeptide (TPR) repeat protein